MSKVVTAMGRLFLTILLTATLARAAAINGTVTNKSTGKPSAGDKVVLVDLSAGMAEAATAKTDTAGHFILTPPGVGPYLVRADHQGGSYYIAAPKEGAKGEIGVYDTAEKVEGVGLDADLLLIEAKGQELRAQERFMIRNASQPPRAQFSAKTFEFILPDGAVLDSVSASRPGGMATTVPAMPLKPKGHYTINVPIQPSQGDKETIFELQYHLAYAGKATLKLQPTMTADAIEVYLAKGIEFSAATGADFQKGALDARVVAYVAKNISAGQAITFTVSGEGQIPREPAEGTAGTGAGSTASTGAAGQDAGDMEVSATMGGPGGGIGAPMSAPDPLSRYKGWILALLVLLIAAATALFLRKQGTAPVGASAVGSAYPTTAASTVAAPQAPTLKAGEVAPAATPGALIAILKEELFALESARLTGSIEEGEYAESKAALETLIKRALKR